MVRFGLNWLGSASNGFAWDRLLSWVAWLCRVRLGWVGLAKVILSLVMLGLDEFSLDFLDFVVFTWLVFGCIVLVWLELGIDNEALVQKVSNKK